MNGGGRGGESFDREKLEKERRLMNTPIDFDELIADGILAREGSWYRVLDHGRVPEHVWAQVQATSTPSEGGPLLQFRGRRR